MHSKFFLFITILFFSCNSEKDEYKTVNIDNVISVNIPYDWNCRETRGIDGYTFKLSKDNHTIIGEVGEFANQLKENSYPVYDIKLKDTLIRGSLKIVDPIGYHFSESPQDDYELNVFSKQYYMYDTINGLSVRVSKPKRTGVGTLGIYLRNVSKCKNVSMYIDDADSATALTTMKIFKSLKKL